MFGHHVEIWDVDHYVLAVDQHDLSRWLSRGYALADRSRVLFAADRALRHADYQQLCSLWRALFGPLPARHRRSEIEDAIREAARRPRPRLQLLIREFKRGYVGEPLTWPRAQGGVRLDSEHYLVVHAVDADEKPVAGVALEVVIAGGEVKNTATGRDGFARVERIHAATAEIRVLNVDGALWRPLEGAPAQLSSSDQRVRWHVVSQGECLSNIAHRHGLPSWRKLWEHPKNEGLRAQRKSPHALLPGDHVALPGVTVHAFVRSTDATHRLEVLFRVRHGFTLAPSDLSFRPGSCVFLGKCDDLTDPVALAEASGVDALATALIQARDHPDRRLLIAGHCDASGGPDVNQSLSEKRARSVKHLLMGERQAWVELVHAQSTPADSRQILAWLWLARGFPCAPRGHEPADDRHALRAFQAAYNRHFHAAIAEDGVLGPESWGAIFDVYQEQLAQRLDTDSAGLSSLRGAVQFCGAAETCGWGSFWALHGAPPGEGARYRRSEIMFFEAAQEPGADDLAPGPLAPPCFAIESIAVERGTPLVWLCLQTADDLGFRRGDVALVFSSDGVETRGSTDEDGVWLGQVRAAREIAVRRADGGPLRLGSSTAETAEVLIRPHWASRSVTDLVVVGSADARLVAAQREQLRRYAAITDAGPRTARGVLSSQDALVGEPMEELPRAPGQPRSFTRRMLHSHVADNLLLAAGSSSKLIEVVKTWLGDYHSESVRRGFVLQVIEGGRLSLISEDGATLGRYHLSERARVSGRMGLHGLVESDRVASGAIFVDLATAQSWLRAGLQERDDEQAPRRDGPPDVPLRELVDARDRDAYADCLTAELARGRVELAYYVPAEVSVLARVGGTGLLEPYPSESLLREHVHARNMAVARTAGVVYRAYVDDVSAAIRNIDASPERAKLQGKPHPEAQLIALAHVEGGPIFPRPAGASEAEYAELLEAVGDSSGYRALRALSEKRNEIFETRTAGSCWLKSEITVEPKVGKTKAKITLNFEVSTDRNGSFKLKPALAQTLDVSGGQVEIEVDREGNVKAKGKGGRLGPLEVELSDGVTKLTYMGVSTIYDARQQQVSIEHSFSLRDLVVKATKRTWGPQGEPEWVKDLPEVKIKTQAGMQLSRSEDVEAVVLRTPGANERKPLYNFGTFQWSTMVPHEKTALEALGFDHYSWEKKDMPETTKRPFADLSDAQRLLVRSFLPLGIDVDWESNWRQIMETEPLHPAAHAP